MYSVTTVEMLLAMSDSGGGGLWERRAAHDFSRRGIMSATSWRGERSLDGRMYRLHEINGNITRVSESAGHGYVLSLPSCNLARLCLLLTSSVARMRCE